MAMTIILGIFGFVYIYPINLFISNHRLRPTKESPKILTQDAFGMRTNIAILSSIMHPIEKSLQIMVNSQNLKN